MIKKMFFTVFASLFLVLSFAVVPASSAPLDPTSQACDAIGAVSGAPGDCSDPVGPSVDDTIKLAINIFSFIVGIAAVIMVIVGGMKYVTSAGDSSNVQGAKNTILYAVIGLVVVALAQIIVRFVLDETT